MPITLNNGGARVIAVRCLGAIHDFVMLNGLSDTPAARSAIVLANAMLASGAVQMTGQRPQDLLRSPRALLLSRIGAPELAGFHRQISPSGKPIIMTQWERARFRQ
jgi:hypothetical protein